MLRQEPSWTVRQLFLLQVDKIKLHRDRSSCKKELAIKWKGFGGVASPKACGGRSQKNEKTHVAFKKIIQFCIKSNSVKHEVGHGTFVSFLGTWNSIKKNKLWVFEETTTPGGLVMFVEAFLHAKQDGCFGMVSHKRQQHAATQHAFPELQPFMHEFRLMREVTWTIHDERSFRVPVTRSEHEH